VKTYRLGYHETTARVIIRRDQLTEKTFRLAAAPLLFDEAVISAHRVHTDTTMENPDLVVADHRLRQNLGMTIAKTLENEPGLDQISMGPAPARPVLRGLGGDRLLVLEDGERTGDLSATSADHAVSIDPMTTTRIEVIRGPEALIYGANAMGGVINVRREAVPRAKPEQLTGSLTLQGTSVNDGAAGALEISAPIGPLTARGDISLRRAQDVQTPDGVLRNTGIQTKNGSLGLSLVQNWGFLGMAGGGYVSEYGIPPDPIGGHPNGVDIDMQRYHVTTESQFNISLKSVRHLFVKHTYSRYTHQEIEASGTLGMEFGVNTHNISAILHFCECGPLNNARIGFWGEYRDYASGGLTFTPDSKELTGAAYRSNQMGIMSPGRSATFASANLRGFPARFPDTITFSRISCWAQQHSEHSARRAWRNYSPKGRIWPPTPMKSETRIWTMKPGWGWSCSANMNSVTVRFGPLFFAMNSKITFSRAIPVNAAGAGRICFSTSTAVCTP
jgi:iron complex outermembrane receptor protein